VGLDPDAVVLVLGRARPAQLGQDLGRLAHPLGEHGPHRVARPHLHRLHRGQPLGGQGGRDQAQVRADVVGPLQDLSLPAAAGVHLGQGVEDGGGADPQPQRGRDRAQQVAGLQRGRLVQQGDQALQLAGLGAGPLGLGDLVQAGEHPLHLQGGRPGAGRLTQQLLGGQAQVAGVAGGGQDLLGGDAGGLGDSPGGQPVGEAQLHPGEVGRDLALAQQRHRRQQVGRGLAEQPGQAVDQLQPGAGPLQVPVGLGDALVPHPPSFPVGQRPTQPAVQAGYRQAATPRVLRTRRSPGPRRGRS
jgi:hypothetical protein